MSNQSGEGRGAKINKIFEEMSYREEPQDFSSVKKWIKEGRKCELNSFVNGKYVSKGASKVLDFCGEKVTVKVLKTETDLQEVYQDVVKNEVGMGTKEAPSQIIMKFQKVINDHITQLVQLEALAGKIPTKSIRKFEVPIWNKSVNGSFAEIQLAEIKGLEASQMLLQLSWSTYALKNILPSLSARLQAGGTFTLFINVQQENLQLLMPVLYLIEKINEAKIIELPINVLLVEAEGSKVLESLSKVDKSGSRKLKDSLMVIGDLSISPLDVIGGRIRPANLKLVHYVIDHSSSPSTDVPDIFNNVWFSGMDMNLSCRPLLFVDGGSYDRVIKELKEKLDKIENDGTCDSKFVPRSPVKSKSLERALQLGASIYPATSNLTVPTLIYDIGTSSDLVAFKEAGHGHILVVIKYRTAAELVSLSNNFGVPDLVNVYTGDVRSIATIRKLNGRIIRVNGAGTDNPLENNWLIVSKSLSSDSDSKTETKSVAIPDCKEWAGKTVREKMMSIYKVSDDYPVALTLLSSLIKPYYELAVEGKIAFQDSQNVGPSGLILNGNPISESEIVSCIVPLAIRGQPILIATLSTKLSSNVDTLINKFLPKGLATIVTVGSTQSAIQIMKNCSMIWILNGEDAKAKLNTSSLAPTNKFLAATSGQENALLFSELALSTMLKKIYV